MIDSNVHTAAAGSGSIHSSPQARRSGVASPDRDGDHPALLGAGPDAGEEAADRRRLARARTADFSTRSYSRSDSAQDVDDSSTVSGTTVTEEGWGSGQGSDGEGAEAAGLALDGGAVKGAGYGGEAQATAAPSKRNSLRRVLDSAR